MTATQTPSLHLDKSATPTSYVKGTAISYSYMLTNTAT